LFAVAESNQLRSSVTLKRPRLINKAVHDQTPLAATDLRNDRVLPFYETQSVELMRMLTDRGTEYCGKVEQHEFQLYLAVNETVAKQNPAGRSSLSWRLQNKPNPTVSFSSKFNRPLSCGNSMQECI
jgi:hypothetical protein